MRHQYLFHLFKDHLLGSRPVSLLIRTRDRGIQFFPEPTAKCADIILGGGVKMSGSLPSSFVLLPTFIKHFLRPISEVKDPYGILYLTLFRTFILVAFATGIPIAGASLKRTDHKN